MRMALLPPEEVDAIYGAEVDAAIAKLPEYKTEEERYPFGFVPWAEKINGRAAMMGFTILLIIETVLGKVGRCDRAGALRCVAARSPVSRLLALLARPPAACLARASLAGHIATVNCVALRRAHAPAASHSCATGVHVTGASHFQPDDFIARLSMV
jgi:hypothetical protein